MRRKRVIFGVDNKDEEQATKAPKINHDELKNIIMLSQLSAKAYLSIDEIRKEVPNLILSGRDERLQLNWFLQEFPDEQVFSVEGTNNFVSFLIDINFFEKHDELLGIRLHEGFRESAYRLYAHIEKRLDKSKLITFTGHSLGAASTTIMGMIAQAKGFNVRVVSFAQPRVTDAAGAKKYENFPLIRVVNKRDPTT